MKITGLGGVVTGRKGDIVMYVRKGQTLGRQHQPNVFNPNTLNQRAAREKFKILAGLASKARPAIEIGFGESLKSSLASGYNMFLKYNPNTVQVSKTGNDVVVEELRSTLGNMVLSKGNMQGVSATANFSTPSTVTVNVSLNKAMHKNTAEGMGACFVVYLYCLELNKGLSFVSTPVSYEQIMEGDADNYTETLAVKVPTAEWQGLRVNAYCFGKLIPKGVYELNRRYPAPASDTINLGNAEIE